MATAPREHSQVLLMSSQVQTIRDRQEESRAQYQLNPGKWAHDELGYELKYIQPEILKALARGSDVAVQTGHKCGKTFVSAVAVLWWLSTRVASKVPTTAPGERQLKHILWAEVGKLYRAWRRKQGWDLTAGMHLYHKSMPEQWFALGVYSNEAGNIEGFHTEKPDNLLVLVDEAKGVKDDFFDAVASMQGQRLLTSVPPLNAQGYFVKVVTELKDTWKVVRGSAEESPFVSKKWLEKMEREWIRGSPTWQAKIEGRIPTSSSEDLVFTLAQIEGMQQRYTSHAVDYSERLPGLGVDVARFGDDRTVRCAMQGFRVLKIKETQKRDTMDTVGRVQADLEQLARLQPGKWDPHAIPVAVDDTGLGGGVTDRLRELEYNVIAVNFGERARRPDLYANRRAELWFTAAEQADKLEIPTDDIGDGAGARLAAELSWPRIKYTSTGRALEPKEAIKKRLGRSPDIGDAYVLAVEAALGPGDGGARVEVW